MTPDERNRLGRQRRQAGRRIVEEQTRRQVRTFLDELRNGTRNYRTVASLRGQVAQEYRGRAVMELLQNAHDVLAVADGDDPQRISFVLRRSPKPELLVANSGRPFRPEDFSGICQLAQSPKDPNESVGNKGLGFQSVLELSTRPEVWSTAPAGIDVSFAFGFDPGVRDPIARVAGALAQGEQRPTDDEFGSEPVVEWSEKQISEYLESLEAGAIDLREEVDRYLSPYVFPRPLDEPSDHVAGLLADGHVTVIRLPLDGGRAGGADEAVESVREQLKGLDEAAMVFLPHLSVLRIEVDEEAVELTRRVEPDLIVAGTRREPDGAAPGTRHARVLVGRTAADSGDATERSFHVWSRIAGGPDRPEETERIAAAVRHLPNRWPEVRKVEVAVAVEETREARRGTFVIFLPTGMETGVGAHVNAPFHGSLDRTKIDFGDEYNELLLELVTDLVLDAVTDLVVNGPAEAWRGWAVIDLLGRIRGSHASDDPGLTRRLRERARDRDGPLDRTALILCDDGWRLPGDARTMPRVPADDPFGEEKWRARAGFAVASSALDERREAVEALLRSLGGTPGPLPGEWARTLERMAERVGQWHADPQPDRPRPAEAPPDWNKLLSSVVAVLPPELRSDPKEPDDDPLAKAAFLPTEDGRLVSATDAVRIFFQPRRGADDAADFVGSVPPSLKRRIAFLHREVRTHEGPQRRRTEIQKFLDGRFVRSFRKEDLLREVIVPALPELPASHSGPEAAACANALAWTLEVIGDEEPEGLSPLLARLPVACAGGWFPMREAAFGPGWVGCCGDHLKTLAAALPGEEGERLLRSALLPPGDDRWLPQGDVRSTNGGHSDGTGLLNRSVLFALAGVTDGLRLEACEPVRYWMSRSNPGLPDNAPDSVPQSAWDDWRGAVLGQVEPDHWQQFQYELQDVRTLPLLHRGDLDAPARQALSDLVLASVMGWEDGWKEVTIRLRRGNWRWSQRIASPLKHWLATRPWLDDRPDEGPRPLHQRWFVPESLLRGLSGRYRHLSPLSMALARRLGEDEGLLESLRGLGLNVYPTEAVRTGPALLETLADVAGTLADGADRPARQTMPVGGFDVLLGQIRHAWRHLGPEEELPARFIIRTSPRTLAVRATEELADVYLPGHGWRTRLLREHGQPIMAMRPQEAAGSVGDRLVELGARRAVGLEEHCLINGRPAGNGEGAQTLADAGLNWLPVVLLALHAHGGGNPAGPATDAWHRASARLRRARVRQCRSIEVELRDAGLIVARSEPRAHWLSRDRILVLHRDIAQNGSYEEAAAALQAILDRQDLLKDLRLVLGALAGEPRSTAAQVEAALDRAEIDAVAAADIRHRWDGDPSTLVHRIRPVLRLLDISDDGLDAAATDTAGLTAWLTDNVRIPEWPTENLLTAARECYDDFGMGFRARQVLCDRAELPKWNEARRALGDRYEEIENSRAEAQARRYLDESARLLRAFARHVATADAGVGIVEQGELFARVNAVHEGLEEDPEWPHLLVRWSQDWWEVPFDAVFDALRERYKNIEEVREPHLNAVADVSTLDELRSAIERGEVDLEPDPREVARGNQNRLKDAVRGVRELYEAYLEKRGARKEAEPTSRGKAPEARLDDSMYLREWPEDDLVERAKRVIGRKEFRDEVAGCTTVEEMREKLGITREDLDRVREKDQRGKDEKERTKRTVKVAEVDHVIGGPVSYGELFERLKRDLPEPRGPDADLDAFTSRSVSSPGPLAPKQPRVGSEVGRRGGKTSHLYGSPHLPELVGIVGEMHAFRFLRAKFDIDESAWVSESRTSVVDLLDGEKDETSDSHGYDFRFTYEGITWCVEVKATTGHGTSFDLPSSELDAASRIAPRKHERWRILRVRKALSAQPEFDWLPNPFEPGAGELLRLRQGGVTVEYSRSDQLPGLREPPT